MTERMENMAMEMQEQMKDHNMPQHMPMHMDLIETLNECEATCEHMVTHLLMHTDPKRRMVQIQYLRDCADICTLTSKYIARMSVFSKWAANICASICEMCANECISSNQ